MATKETEKTPVEIIETAVEFKNDAKYWVKNLCNWIVGFARITAVGDVSIPANGKILLTDEEIRGQIFKNNVLFVGNDGAGSHARVYVENKDFRIDVGFETKTTKQKIVDDTVLAEIFAEKSFSAFKTSVEDKVITDAEKQALMTYAKAHKYNDYEKITFMEEYTEYKY